MFGFSVEDDHIHVIHDCAFSDGTCRDVWRKQVESIGEIYAQGTAADKAVFGYQERFAEYRYKPSEILGTFASNAPSTLDIWHLAQNFGSLPALNSSFIESSTPVARVIAVPSQPHFLWDAFYNYTCARPMPAYSVPGFVDHF